ncbi:beta-lactamase-like protein [Piptocephalis cylindrospora]|uniref:Beta-lactamase-like protein n=1 Tax=Piptocephalis cylindrospora TaxID=1907219 RepID=A0A4P9Y700_9FUNG|nr:beta-lactamase-like protein [Piptocephalis cylindrospora]|eukprot:RKP14001.1 beta-lactamase-like protein [Piptocephalis cylindrospora]
MSEEENSLTCPVCPLDLTTLSLEARQNHVLQCLEKEDNSEDVLFTPTLPNDVPVQEAGSQDQHQWSIVFKRPASDPINPTGTEKKRYKQSSSPIAGPGNGSERRRKRACPFYKWIPGTKVTVDAFAFGAIQECDAYFLTHFHSDHYGGLTKTWAHGPIFCSHVTANLVKGRLGVQEDWVKPLEMDRAIYIPELKGHVTLIEANHCPGSVLFLFELADQPGQEKRAILHTGDFRAIPDQIRHPSLRNRLLHTLFLDTTYLDPKYTFPPQTLVLEEIQRSYSSREKTLFLVGTYSIGKERVIKAVAQALGSKVWASGEKRRILGWLQDDTLSSLLTTDPTEAQVHCCGMWDLKEEALAEYLSAHVLKGTGYTRLVAFRPTGWTFSPPKGRGEQTPDRVVLQAKRLTPQVWIYPVPYSEHSSFRELQGFIRSIQVERVIPTVGVSSPQTRKRMTYWLGRWKEDKAKNGLSPLPDPLIPHW